MASDCRPLRYRPSISAHQARSRNGFVTTNRRASSATEPDSPRASLASRRSSIADSRSSSSRAASSRANETDSRSARAAPYQRPSAVWRRSNALDVSAAGPPPRCCLASLTRPAKCIVSTSLESTVRIHPGGRVRIWGPVPPVVSASLRMRRSREMYDCRVNVDRDGGWSLHSSWTSRSKETTCPAFNASNANTARCLRPPKFNLAPSTSADTGPRSLTLTFGVLHCRVLAGSHGGKPKPVPGAVAAASPVRRQHTAHHSRQCSTGAKRTGPRQRDQAEAAHPPAGMVAQPADRLREGRVVPDADQVGQSICVSPTEPRPKKWPIHPAEALPIV